MKYLKLFESFNESKIHEICKKSKTCSFYSIHDHFCFTPSIIIDGLNDFLTLIDKNTVEKVNRYKNI